MSLCDVVEKVKDKDGRVVMDILDCGHKVMVLANDLDPRAWRRRCKVCTDAKALQKALQKQRQRDWDADIPF